MVQIAQVIQALRPLKWRGLELWFIESAPVNFSHSLAERRYPYIDGAGHDNTGMDPLECTVRLRFLETVKRGLFTNIWPKFRKAVFDGSSGDLEHPLLGKFRARVKGGQIGFAAQETAGVTVDVTFVSTVDDIDRPDQFKDPQPDGVQVAAAAQAAANQYDIPWPEQNLDISLLDAFKALQTCIWSAQVTFAGYGNQIVGTLEEMITSAEALTDPKAYPVYDNLIFAWSLAQDAVEEAEKDLRARGSRYVQSDTTIAAFAAEVGNTETEVAQLNYALLKSPVIPAGTAVHYYTGK
jgi:hypothetical protein